MVFKKFLVFLPIVGMKLNLVMRSAGRKGEFILVVPDLRPACSVQSWARALNPRYCDCWRQCFCEGCKRGLRKWTGGSYYLVRPAPRTSSNCLHTYSTSFPTDRVTWMRKRSTYSRPSCILMWIGIPIKLGCTFDKLISSDLRISDLSPNHLVVTKMSDRGSPLSRIATPTLSSLA